jgi:hypothetical protein
MRLNICGYVVILLASDIHMLPRSENDAQQLPALLWPLSKMIELRVCLNKPSMKPIYKVQAGSHLNLPGATGYLPLPRHRRSGYQ